jgi:hypothetical protein
MPKCPGCKGSRRCFACDGRGKVKDWWGFTKNCGTCRNRKICQTCNGKGEVRNS